MVEATGHQLERGSFGADDLARVGKAVSRQRQRLSIMELEVHGAILAVARTAQVTQLLRQRGSALAAATIAVPSEKATAGA